MGDTTTGAIEVSSNIPQHPLAFYGIKGKELGSGTYGVVNKYSKGIVDVAIKKMSDDDGVRASTLREVACTIRLIHPNVVTTLDVITGKTDLFLVMPIALSDANKAFTTDQWLFTDGEFKKNIIYQVASGIGYCLSRGVINRDIKPQNILVYPGSGGGRPQLKIADFGLARTYMCSLDSGATHEVYTLYYRPPEVLLGSSYTDSADIWAMGCTLYELCTGKILFPGNSEAEMLRLFNQEFGNLEKEWPGVVDMPNWNKRWSKGVAKNQLGTLQPIDLQGIIREMIQIDPDKRKSPTDIIKDPYFNSVRDEKVDSLLMNCSCTSTLLLREFPLDRSGFSKDEMRKIKILEDWLVNVNKMFKLSLQGLMLAMELVEIIYKLKKPKDTDLQTLGCTCLWMASKYYEIYAPEIADFTYISNGLATKEKLVENEKMILEVIKYDLIRSTSADFLYSFLKAGNYDRETKNYAKTLLPLVHIFSSALRKKTQREKSIDRTREAIMEQEGTERRAAYEADMAEQAQWEAKQAGLPVAKKIVMPHTEAMAALYMACSHTGCSFKHTAKLDETTMKLVDRIYDALKNPKNTAFLKTAKLTPGEITMKATKVL